MGNKTKKLLSGIRDHLLAIIEADKEDDIDTVVEHHEAIDELLHDFVGEEGLTSEEKKEKKYD